MGFDMEGGMSPYAQIEQLRAENARLRQERDEARRREREWHDASVKDRAELHALKQSKD